MTLEPQVTHLGCCRQMELMSGHFPGLKNYLQWVDLEVLQYVVSMSIFYRVAVFACVLTYLSSLPAYVTPPASDPSVPLSFLCCRM